MTQLTSMKGFKFFDTDRKISIHFLFIQIKLKDGDDKFLFKVAPK